MTDFFALFFEANWDLVVDFFTKGKPPVGLVFVGFNALILILWMVRRMRQAPKMRYDTFRSLQALFLAANVLILMEGDLKRLMFW
jgi:hypothetical protein